VLALERLMTCAGQGSRDHWGLWVSYSPGTPHTFGTETVHRLPLPYPTTLRRDPLSTQRLLESITAGY
jgi:hypothetical protein